MQETISDIKTKSGPKGRPEIDPEICKGCGLCIPSCPKDVLSISKKTNSQGIQFSEYDESGNCIACKNCAITCPERAISIYKFVEEE
ncbi:MAG: 4Fe-4S dicluster domain-containing protein [Spirochaetales bacterium]|nr:4Fe-4S dicluster domain-containing protein [Spirochaetales bacterium]